MRTRLLALVLASTATLALVPCPAMAQEPSVAQLQQTRLELAEKGYAQVSAKLDAGAASAEDAYRWSIRWLEAALGSGAPAGAALEAHLSRMSQVEALARKRVEMGMASPDEATAAAWFVAEARLWVKQGRR